MTRTSPKILKATDVELQGRFQLSAPQPGTAAATAAKPMTTQPAANIIENTTDFAVIELTCSCGQKTQIRCEYATPGSTGQNQ